MLELKPERCMTAGCAVVDRGKTNANFVRSPTNEYCIK